MSSAAGIRGSGARFRPVHSARSRPRGGGRVQGRHEFHRVFYRRLHMPSDQRAWNDEHGPAIIRFLEEHFPDKPDAYDRTGPYRYVGVVYRHAGIPAVGLPAFAQLLTRLFWEHGRHSLAPGIRRGVAFDPSSVRE